MPLTKQQKDERKARAKEWKAFRAKHLLSQADLAKSLDVAKRTVQHVETEDSDIIPHVSTLQKFATLKSRFEGNNGTKKEVSTGNRRRSM